ncbi:hypothetical protein E2C01_081187 [Portunus trituberculatus]|uniref:Uncharacterized protein n=1 Tax=Portunus trituberculatus TaxID=210409 RepID=A0A5B7IR98_PORTR|nr:hypothetical protein [Portunus trituberculatus]
MEAETEEEKSELAEEEQEEEEEEEEEAAAARAHALSFPETLAAATRYKYSIANSDNSVAGGGIQKSGEGNLVLAGRCVTFTILPLSWRGAAHNEQLQHGIEAPAAGPVVGVSLMKNFLFGFILYRMSSEVKADGEMRWEKKLYYVYIQ